MFQVSVLYNQPDDRAKFDEYYDGTHVALAQKIPGLQRMSVSRPGPDPEGNAPAYHLVTVLEFADEAAFGAGMASAEGQAAVGDVPNFATGGVTMLMGPSQVV